MRLLLILALLAPALLQAPTGAPPIRVGESAAGCFVEKDRQAPGGLARAFTLVAEERGRVTVELVSYDFDARLGAERTDGTRHEDEDGGIETNARLALELAAGESVALRVTSPTGALGDFTLTVTAGDPPRLEAEAETDRRSEFHRRAADRALEREELPKAAHHLRARGLIQLEAARLPEARRTFTEMLALAAREDRRPLAGDAGFLLSRVSIRLGELDRAQEESRAALAHFEALGDVKRQISVLGALVSALYQAGRLEEALVAVEWQVELAEDSINALHRAEAALNLGVVYRGLGRLEEARDALELGLARCAEHGRDDWRAVALTNLGAVLHDLGDRPGAVDVLDEAVALQRRLGDARGLATSLTNLGRLHLELQDLARARELCSEALEHARGRKDAYAESWALGWLAATYLNLANFPRALELFEQRLVLARRLGDGRTEGWALWGVGSVRFAMGQPEEAGVALEAARQLAVRCGDEDLRVQSLVRLGGVAFRLGDYALAEERYATALELARRAKDPRSEASALSGIGLVHAGRYELEAAEAAQREALALDGDNLNVRLNLARVLRSRGGLLAALEMQLEVLREAEEIGLPGDVREAHGALVRTYHDLGEYERSRQHCDEALRRARASGDLDAESEALAAIADLRMHLGDHQTALQLLDEHLQLACARGWRRVEARIVTEIGRAWLELGDAERAAQELERARELHAQLKIPAGAILTNLAAARRNLGELDVAAELLRERLELARRIGNPAGEAWALTSQARLARVRGDVEAVLARAGEALAAFERAGSEHRSIDALSLLAWASLQRGELARAQEALARAEHLLDRTADDGLDIQDAAGLRSRFRWIGQFAQDLSAALATGAETEGARAAAVAQGFRAAGRWKGRALLAGIVEHRAGGRTLAATQLRRERRAALVERDAALRRIPDAIARGGELAAIDALRVRAGELDTRAEELERELAERFPRDAALHAAPAADPTELAQRVLDPRTALLEFADGEEQTFVYALTSRGLRRVDLGSKETLTHQVEELVPLIADPSRLGSVSEVADRAGALYERLIAPVLPFLGAECEQLLIVPSAGLAGLPFEALVVNDAVARADATGFDQLEFLIDRFEVAYGPSSPVLLELADIGPRSERGRVLILADPRYASEPEPSSAERPSTTPFALASLRAAPQPGELARLPKTRDEALAIAGFLLELTPEDDAAAAAAQRLRTRRSGSISTEVFELHLGELASTDHLRGDLHEYFVLHVAAHGFVDREEPRRTGIALSYSDSDDGFFTIADALELDLDCDLTVLSACDTASGELQAGEGVQSFARAFLYAGSRSVVASLWQVSDWAAAETMQSFYRAAVAGGLQPAAALREAKLALRRSTAVRGVPVAGEGVDAEVAAAAHPFFWAPFIHIGLLR